MTRPALAALLLLFAPLAARAQDVRAAVEGAPPQLGLSGSMRVTLSLEGPKPLRVELPKQLLTADANAIWGIRPDRGEEARTTPIGPDRERWSRVYRLTPFPPVEGPAAGKRVASFSPVTVNGKPVTFPPVEVEVTSAVGSAAVPPHGIVGLEDPILTTTEDDSSPLPWVAAAAVSALAIVVLLVRRPKRKPVPPYEAAVTALTELLAAEQLGAAGVERLAAVLRTFVQQKFGIPATTLTTAELLAAVREQGWAVGPADALGAILDACDRAKFAGLVPDSDGCRQLVRLAIDWVDAVGRPVAPA